MSIPALSVRQPWAELILSGRKAIEIRSWSTRYRGDLWLHTGMKSDSAAEARFGLGSLFKGGYVGRVRLSTVLRFDRARWREWRHLHLDPGPFPNDTHAWLLDSTLRFAEPLKGPGQLGLFDPDEEVQAELARLAAAAAAAG